MTIVKTKGKVANMEIGDGRYRLVRRLGVGGTSVVYQAVDRVLGRTVAVKVLNAAIDMGVLQREGRSLACLSHPNIVAVHDVVEGEKGPYLVMEYVEGAPLDQWLYERSGAKVDVVLRVFHEVVQAVAHAHARGILHCDLKPANVLLSTTGETKLTDFTLARRRSPDGFVGTAGGTTPYAAPEQVTGEQIGPWTDVYGLGALLREMLSACDAGCVPASIVDAVSTAMSFEPCDRFSDVASFLAALPLPLPEATMVAAVSVVPNLTRVQSEPQQAPIRHRLRYPLVATGAVLVLATGAVAGHLNAAASPSRITVPDLVATQSDSAQLVTKSLALRPRVTQSYSASTQPGIVISQMPVAGSQVARLSTISMVISEGPRPVLVPDIHGQTQAAAISTLRGLGLKVSVNTQETVFHAPGEVLTQIPPAQTLGIPGKTVTITVSLKPWWWIF